MILDPELRRQLSHDDRRLDVNDLFVFDFRSSSSIHGDRFGLNGRGGTSIAGSGFVVGVSVTGPGVTSGVARMREIGGKTERLIFSSPSARFLGFF